MGLHAIHGLTVRSPFPLPEVPAVAGTTGNGDKPDIKIRRADEIAVGTRESGVRFHEDGDRIHIQRNTVGSFWIEGGNRIHVTSAANVSPPTLRQYLLKGVIPIVLLQRGVLTLHASVVTTEHGAIVLAGSPGVGKSTIATALATRGHRVLCNDVAAIRIEEQPTVYPGISAVKLDTDTAEIFGDDLRRQDWTASNLDKSYYTVPGRTTTGEDRLEGIPIRAVYLLSVDDSDAQGSSIHLHPLGPTRATVALLGSIYTATLMDRAGKSHALLAHCATLAESVSINRLSRSSDAKLTSLSELRRTIFRDSQSRPEYRGDR